MKGFDPVSHLKEFKLTERPVRLASFLNEEPLNRLIGSHGLSVPEFKVTKDEPRIDQFACDEIMCGRGEGLTA